MRARNGVSLTSLFQCLLSACIVLYLMFVLSWKLTAVTIALAPLCILAAVISSYISSSLKSKRLAADEGAAAIARLSLTHPAAVKALCIEDAVAAHYGALHDAFIASFSPSKNSISRVLVSSSFQVPPFIMACNTLRCNTCAFSRCRLPSARLSAANLSRACKCDHSPKLAQIQIIKFSTHNSSQQSHSSCCCRSNQAFSSLFSYSSLSSRHRSVNFLQYVTRSMNCDQPSTTVITHQPL